LVRLKSNDSRGSGFFTIIELLAGIFVTVVAMISGKSVADRYGTWAGVGAGSLGAVISAGVVVLLFRWLWRWERQRLKMLKEKYRDVYRVIQLPSPETSIIKPQGAEIRIGDHGWEAGPNRGDGLIYLQGLTPEWTVAWHSGFRPDQVQWVSEKPTSQYDDPPPPCPFSVVERETMTWGRPHHSHSYFQHPVLYPHEAEELKAKTRDRVMARATDGTRGMRLAFLTGALALLLIGGTVYASRNWLLTEWYLRNLDSGDASERETAALRLGKLGAVRALPRLARILLPFPEEDTGVRNAAAAALAKIGPRPAAIPYLIPMLKDDAVPEHQLFAAWALGEIGPPARSAVPDLREALHGPQEPARRAAAEALRKIEGP
jgi:HEAT repeat protein